jgi:uncharacterized protein (TIGR02231 family)
VTESIATATAESSADPSRGRVVRVTLFEDRAEVTRVATFAIEPGVRWLEFRSVSALLDERSVRARIVSGDAIVLAAKARWHLHRLRSLGREEIEALERESEQASDRAQRAALLRQRVEGEAQRIQTLLAQWAAGLSGVPRKLRDESIRLTWRNAHDALTGSLRTTLDRVHEARVEHAEAIDVRDRAEARKREGLIEQPRIEGRVDVQIDAKGAGEITVEVIYRVASAVWRPEHMARLVGEGAKASVEIVTFATAWQRTGERWEDVEMHFSTARPARVASPPLLHDDVIASRKKTDAERQRVVVEARDQAVMVAGLDRSAKSTDEMPGVDDGGEPQSFTARGAVTLPSDGAPFRIEIARTAVRATVERVAFPERAPVAHIRATATHPGPHALLAGPVRLARGAGLVGRARLDFVAPGEPFEIGFGVDGAVRVRRTTHETRDTTVLTSSQKVRRQVNVFLSNLSRDRRTVQVTERVPVSEIETVEIVLVDREGWQFDAKDGFARRDVTLEPNGTSTVKLVYEIRASSRVVLPF